MNHEVTLANAQWCRDQASKYLKLAVAIEEILKGESSTKAEADLKQKPLFVGNNPTPSFEQVQKEAAKGGRVKNIVKTLGAREEDIRNLLKAQNSQFYIGYAGWIRRNGTPDPFKKDV